MDDTEIDIREIIGVLRRRLRLILVTIAIIVVLAGLVTFSLTPKYTSSALLLVDTTAKDLLDPAAAITSAASESARVDSEVEILKSDNILLSVISDQKLVSDKEFGVKLGWKDRLLGFLRIQDTALPSGQAALQSVLTKLRKAVSIHRIGLTYLISASVTSQSPAKAAKLANAIANAYITAQVDAKISNTLAARNILQAQLKAASSAIISGEQAFDNYISDNIDTITAETGRTDIADMRNQLEQMSAARAALSDRASAADKAISLKNWVEVASNLQDEALTELNKQRDAISKRLEAAQQGSQLAINLRAELGKIDNNLATAAQKGLVSLRQQITQDQSQSSSLRQQIRTTVVNSNLPPAILTRIYELQQNAEVSRNQYQNLITRISELEAQAQTQIADSRIVSNALPPADPSFPNKALILALAGLSSLGLGVGLAFLYENFVGGFASEGQVEAVLHLPVVTAVPHVNLSSKDTDTGHTACAADLMVNSPLSPYAEAIRRLRLATDHSYGSGSKAPGGEGGKGRVIMISSAVPGEGKSTIALSLGRAYAQAGRTALLIDCDLRKPSLHRYLGVQAEVGLADYLAHADDTSLLSKVIVHDQQTKLAAIVGSRKAELPTDQLAGGATLNRLIEIAKNRFDHIILDSPPILPVVDGLYLAEQSDVIALIVRWASTSQQEARETIAALSNVIGSETSLMTVLNQQESPARGYRYHYGDYYQTK